MAYLKKIKNILMMKNSLYTLVSLYYIYIYISSYYKCNNNYNHFFFI